MFLQAPSVVLLAIGIATSNLFSTGTMAESVCAHWLKTSRSGQKQTVFVEAGNIRGRIDGHSAGRNTTNLKAGTGACGITYTDQDKGACLWGGLNSLDPIPKDQQSGWVTGSNTKNCGKKFFINRGGKRATGKIVDSCSFTDGNKLKNVQGCSTIYVTLSTFIELGGNPGGGRIQIDNWDFDASTPPE